MDIYILDGCVFLYLDYMEDGTIKSLDWLYVNLNLVYSYSCLTCFSQKGWENNERE